METMSLQNIIDANGINLSLTGMSIVFTGLALIALYISVLPRCVALFSKKTKGRPDRLPADETRESDTVDPELIAAMAFVIDREYNGLRQAQRITLSPETDQRVNWGLQSNLRPTLDTSMLTPGNSISTIKRDL